MSTMPINPASGITNPSVTATAASGNAPSENEFLQLLVAQLKYQDPSQPADGTQFVTELAQFTDVSNTTNMSSDLDTIKQLLTTAAAATTAATPTAQDIAPSGSNGSLTNPVVNS
jgi:flagellar basal-body rod modification protein FlgD